MTNDTKWHLRLNDEIREFMLVHCLNSSDILGFLSATLVGEMERNGYSEEFAKKTFDRMLERFISKRKEKK